MKYLMKPRRKGWYLALKNYWQGWSIGEGWFTPFDLLWCFKGGLYNNPRYISIEILGFGLEIGKFEEK